MTAPIAIPDWIAQQDEDEREELAALGVAVDTTATPDDQAARDALASRLLRAMSAVERELEELRQARKREIEFITERYARRDDQLTRRWTFLESAVKSLALLSDFGTKKSRDVGFGTYGRRKSPARAVIEQDDQALAWAREEAPFAVRVSLTLPLIVIEEEFPALLEQPSKLSLDRRLFSEYVLGHGVDVPGVSLQAEHDEAFARPEAPGRS